MPPFSAEAQKIWPDVEVCSSNALAGEGSVCNQEMPADHCLLAMNVSPMGKHGPKVVQFIYASRQEAEGILTQPDLIGGIKPAVVDKAWYNHVAWIMAAGAELTLEGAKATPEHVHGFAFSLIGLSLDAVSFAVPPTQPGLKALVECSGLVVGAAGMIAVPSFTALELVTFGVNGFNVTRSGLECRDSVKKWFEIRDKAAHAAQKAVDDKIAKSKLAVETFMKARIAEQAYGRSIVEKQDHDAVMRAGAEMQSRLAASAIQQQLMSPQPHDADSNIMPPALFHDIPALKLPAPPPAPPSSARPPSLPSLPPQPMKVIP